jgi:hypothetical protein
MAEAVSKEVVDSWYSYEYVPNPVDEEPFGRSRSSKAPTVPAGPEIQ